MPPRPATLLPSTLPVSVPAVLANLEVNGRLGLPPTGMVRGMVVRRANVLASDACNNRSHMQKLQA